MIKKPGRESDQSSAEVKNMCSYTVTFPRLHSMVLN
jgi:hypothetical protein